MVFGADFSKWNASPNFAEQDFAILRAGYGRNNIDNRVRDHVAKAKLCGCELGFYWFSYALNVEMARQEAEYLVNIVEELGVKPGYPLYYDWEYDSERYFKQHVGYKPSRAQVREFADAFCKRLEELGYYAGIYANKEYMKNCYTELNGRYTIWYADWSNKSPGDNSGYPSYYHMRQYTDKPFDRDVCYIDFPSVMKRAGLNGYRKVR